MNTAYPADSQQLTKSSDWHTKNLEFPVCDSNSLEDKSQDNCTTISKEQGLFEEFENDDIIRLEYNEEKGKMGSVRKFLFI